MSPNDPAPTTAPRTNSPTAGYDAWLAIPLERWYADTAQANPHRCQHVGERCGERFLCDQPDHRAGGYPTVELLGSGRLLFHCEDVVLGRTDPGYDARRAGLVWREDAS